jgi:hypothetical protein
MAIAVLVAATLVLSAGAEAKGVQSVTLCGISGCTRTQDQAVGVAFDDSEHTGPPSRPVPFMRALVRFQEAVPPGQNPPVHPRTIPVWFVVLPQQYLIRSGESSGWLRIVDHGGLREFLARVRPYPASAFPNWLRGTVTAQRTPTQPDAAATVANGSFPWRWAGLGVAVAAALVVVAMRLHRRGAAPR